jgi:hypothetical protein
MKFARIYQDDISIYFNKTFDMQIEACKLKTLFANIWRSEPRNKLWFHFRNK